MIQVQRRAIATIKAQFMGFDGDKVVLITNEQPTHYTQQEFKRMFKFTNEEDEKQYETMLEELIQDPTTHQITEEELQDALVEAIEANKVAKEKEEEERKRLEEEENSKKEKKEVEKQPKAPKETPKGEILKNKYLNEEIIKLPFYQQLTKVLCKDGTQSFRYREVTIFQIRGKKKVYCYFTGKFFDEEYIKGFNLTPEKYKHTHNAYIVLEDESQFEKLNEAIQVSADFVDMKKGEPETLDSQGVKEEEEKGA